AGSALNGVSWSLRMRELCLRGATGAVWGASSGLVISRIIQADGSDSEPRRSRFAIQGAAGLTAALASILVIAAVAPACALVFDHKANSMLTALRKAFT